MLHADHAADLFKELLELCTFQAAELGLQFRASRAQGL